MAGPYTPSSIIEDPSLIPEGQQETIMGTVLRKKSGRKEGGGAVPVPLVCDILPCRLAYAIFIAEGVCPEAESPPSHPYVA